MALNAKAIVQSEDADVLLKEGWGLYGGFSLKAAAADATIKVYDCATVAGVADSKLIDVGGLDIDVEGLKEHSNPCEPVKFHDGLVVVVTGANCLATVWYK